MSTGSQRTLSVPPLYVLQKCILDSELSVSIWPADLISFNSVMICECLNRDLPSHAERCPSFYRTSTAVKVTIALGTVISHG